MAREMKYVVIADELHDQPYLFSYTLQHQEFVNRMGVDHSRVVSAGFVAVINNKFKAYGKSVSLGRASRPEDTDIINRMMGLT